MAWLNVDTATELTVHNDPNCEHVVGMGQTDNKGIVHLPGDGGWLDFPTAAAARQHGQSNWPNYRITDCCP